MTLNPPPRLNAITFQVVDELHAAPAELYENRTCHAVVLTGAGRGFCSGIDLKGDEAPGSSDTEEAEPNPGSQAHRWMLSLLATAVLRAHSTAVVTERRLPGLSSGDSLVSLEPTEPECGCDATALRTSATATADGFEVVKNSLFTHGHHSYATDSPFDQCLRNVLAVEIGDGTAQVQKIVITRDPFGRDFDLYGCR